MNRQQVLPLLAIILLVHCYSHAEDAEEPSPALQVRMVVSNQELQVGDGLSLKLVMTNRSMSSVQIAGPNVKPEYVCSLQVTKPDGKTSFTAWHSREQTGLFEQGEILIAAGESWAEYGKAPAVTKRGLAFVESGEYQCFGGVNCALGRYVTKPITITVRKRSPEELAAIKKHEVLISLLFDLLEIPGRRRWDAFMELDGRIKSGSNRQTLNLFRDLIAYQKTGAVEGDAMTHYEAFKKLSVGLDEVRRDQLAMVLGSEARRLNKWKDLFELAGELKEDSKLRRAFRFDLERVIRTGGFKMP